METTVITGGSRGIGAAAVARFAQRGDRVVFLYEKDHEAARKVARATGAEAICCDVADGEAVRRAFASIGHLDNLILCAGICRYGLLRDLSEEDWDRIFAVNVKGIYTCVKAAMPAFLQAQKGSIVTVSSMWGQVGASCEAAYSATKGAVIALTKALAKELGPSGIRVNCVAPGVIDTDMMASFTAEDKAALAEETPVGRLGTAEEVAKLLLYLAGEDAGYITGQVFGVNGGLVI